MGASLGCLVGVDRLELSASAGLYLQWIHAIGLGEDAHYAGGSNDAQVPVVLEDSRVDGHFVGVSFDIDVYLRLRVEHLRQLSEGFLTLLVHHSLARFEEQFITQRDIHLAVLLGHGEVFGAEAKQCVLHACQQLLHLALLFVYHALQLCDGLLPLLQFLDLLCQGGVELLVLALVIGKHRLIVAYALLEQSGVAHQHAASLVEGGTLCAAFIQQVGKAVARIVGSPAGVL